MMKISTRKADIYQKVQVFKRLPYVNISQEKFFSPISLLSYDSLSSESFSNQLSSCLRNLIRFRPYISTRNDKKDLYTEYIKLRFSEDYNAKRRAFCSLPDLSEKELVQRIIATIKLVNNGCTSKAINFERSLLKNVLLMEFEKCTMKKKNLKKAPFLTVFEYHDSLRYGELKNIDPAWYEWANKVDHALNSGEVQNKAHNEKLALLNLRNYERDLVMLNESCKLIL